MFVMTLIILFPDQHSVVYLAARAWKALQIVALENHFWPNSSQLDLTMGQKLSHRLQLVISKLILSNSRLYFTIIAVSSEDKSWILDCQKSYSNGDFKNFIIFGEKTSEWAENSKFCIKQLAICKGKVLRCCLVGILYTFSTLIVKAGYFIDLVIGFWLLGALYLDVECHFPGQ